MNQRCPVCRQGLDPQGRGVMVMSLGGLRLFAVHNSDCSDIVFKGSRAAGYFAFQQGRKILKRKLPMVSRLVEDYARLRRGERRLHG